MTTYDEWKSTELEDPYADELELERREQEMEPDEPHEITPCSHEDRQLAPHSCPFQADVWNDPSIYCTCCDDCQQRCADDI